MTPSEKKNKGFEPLGDILKGAIEKWLDQDAGPGGAVARIWSVWETAVGTEIAENAQPALLKGDTLVVHVVSSTWTQQLRFLKQDMIHNINQAAGKPLISNITFKIGTLS